MAKEHVSLNFSPEMHEVADQIARTIVESGAQTGEYRGIGGHETRNQPPHGTHSQVSIGMGEKTIDIRKLDP